MSIQFIQIPADELVLGNEYFFAWKVSEDEPINLLFGKFGGYVIEPEDGFIFKDVRIINGNNPDQVTSNDTFYAANTGPEISFYRNAVDVRIDKLTNTGAAPAAGGGKKYKQRKSKHNRKSKRSKKSGHNRKTRYH